MDLNDIFSTDKPVWIQLEHPVTGEPLFADKARKKPMRVALLSSDTDAARKAEKEAADAILKMARQAPRGRFVMDSDTADRQNRIRFMSRLHGWENLTLGGKAFDVSDANKAMIYDDLRFGTIRRQIETDMADEGNFLTSAGSASVH